jgi:outer membrane protein assembly factor BamC
MSSELKQTLALLSCLILTGSGCSRHLASETLPPVAPLEALQIPLGMTLLLEDKRYQLPQKPSESQGKSPIDIRPPIQLLALLPGSEAYYQGKQAVLQLEQTTDTRLLWRQIKQWLVQEGITTITRDDNPSVLMTNWITVETLKGKRESRARYRLSLASKKPPLLISELIALEGPLDHLSQDQQQKSKSEDLFQQRTPIASEQRHYAILLLNRLVTDLTKQTPAAETPTQLKRHLNTE